MSSANYGDGCLFGLGERQRRGVAHNWGKRYMIDGIDYLFHPRSSTTESVFYLHDEVFRAVG